MPLLGGKSGAAAAAGAQGKAEGKAEGKPVVKAKPEGKRKSWLGRIPKLFSPKPAAAKAVAATAAAPPPSPRVTARATAATAAAAVTGGDLFTDGDGARARAARALAEARPARSASAAPRMASAVPRAETRAETAAAGKAAADRATSGVAAKAPASLVAAPPAAPAPAPAAHWYSGPWMGETKPDAPAEVDDLTSSVIKRNRKSLVRTSLEQQALELGRSHFRTSVRSLQPPLSSAASARALVVNAIAFSPRASRDDGALAAGAAGTALRGVGASARRKFASRDDAGVSDLEYSVFHGDVCEALDAARRRQGMATRPSAAPPESANFAALKKAMAEGDATLVVLKKAATLGKFCGPGDDFGSLAPLLPDRQALAAAKLILSIAREAALAEASRTKALASLADAPPPLPRTLRTPLPSSADAADAAAVAAARLFRTAAAAAEVRCRAAARDAASPLLVADFAARASALLSEAAFGREVLNAAARDAAATLSTLARTARGHAAELDAAAANARAAADKAAAALAAVERRCGAGERGERLHEAVKWREQTDDLARSNLRAFAAVAKLRKAPDFETRASSKRIALTLAARVRISAAAEASREPAVNNIATVDCVREVPPPR
ncbi:hypothetical protein M885DRAFT_617862 [Pelagophyceae sp. CCMP2097]|nr:hypothetical protein M885DRAFT_617862 [Pelagophyceae sp. CCMP2097]